MYEVWNFIGRRLNWKQNDHGHSFQKSRKRLVRVQWSHILHLKKERCINPAVVLQLPVIRKAFRSLPEASLFEIRGIFTEYKLETPICQVTVYVWLISSFTIAESVSPHTVLPLVDMWHFIRMGVLFSRLENFLQEGYVSPPSMSWLKETGIQTLTKYHKLNLLSPEDRSWALRVFQEVCHLKKRGIGSMKPWNSGFEFQFGHLKEAFGSLFKLLTS